jgi:hypothetical protein
MPTTLAWLVLELVWLAPVLVWLVPVLEWLVPVLECPCPLLRALLASLSQVFRLFLLLPSTSTWVALPLVSPVVSLAPLVLMLRWLPLPLPPSLLSQQPPWAFTMA